VRFGIECFSIPTKQNYSEVFKCLDTICSNLVDESEVSHS
jgi:hypothetical protein